MIRIIGLSGSLRGGSWNTKLLRAAGDRMPQGCELAVADIKEIPLYDQDIEDGDGIPQAVEALKDSIADADGLLLATPEYNGSMPGVLKNAIDWLSRPGKDIPRVFGDKPVALMGATTGGLGTVLSQNAWLPVLRQLKTRPWFGGRLLVSDAANRFDDSGSITDDVVSKQLDQFVNDFVAFVRMCKS